MKTLKESILSSTGTGKYSIAKQLEKYDMQIQGDVLIWKTHPYWPYAILVIKNGLPCVQIANNKIGYDKRSMKNCRYFAVKNEIDLSLVKKYWEALWVYFNHNYLKTKHIDVCERRKRWNIEKRLNEIK